VGTERKRLYLHEVEGQLDVYLRSDHGQEIYCGLRHEGANQRRELARAIVAVHIPNDDEERR